MNCKVYVEQIYNPSSRYVSCSTAYPPTSGHPLIVQINGLVGANQSTPVLIDALDKHFSLPGWSPTKRTAGSNAAGGPARPGAKRMLSQRPAITVKPVRDVKKRTTTKSVVDHLVTPNKVVEEVRMDEVVLSQNEGEFPSLIKSIAQRQAGPSTITSPLVMAPPSLPSSVTRSGGLSHARVKEMLDERDRAWEIRLETRLRTLEQAYERRVVELEKRVEEQLRRLTGTSLPTSSTPTTVVPEFTLTADTPTNIALGKRTQRDTPNQTPRAGPGSSPATKRARIDTTEEEEDSDAMLPHTPSPPNTAAAPRTPSPGHQGVMTDNSRTPGISADFSPPPQFSARKSRHGDDDEEDDRMGEIPYPLFATTPRPSEPRSPTLDAPPSANRYRLGHARAATLTPGRRKPSPAPRAVSEAHKELSTITESDEPSFQISLARRRVASEHTPTRLVPAALRGSSVPVSPPQLSPSPSIGASDREGGFTYTPFPPVPRAVRAQSTLSNSSIAPKAEPLSRGNSAFHSRPTEQVAEDQEDEELDEVEDRHRDVSPLMDYMDVATYGLLGTDSLGQMNTPNHRTLLGTERYRDTRFGDVPMVSWGSPSVDLGPNTPASRRDW